MNIHEFENERQNIWHVLHSFTQSDEHCNRVEIVEYLNRSAIVVNGFKVLADPSTCAGHCFRNRCEMIKMVMLEVSKKLTNSQATSDALREVGIEHTMTAGPRSASSCPWKTSSRLISRISHDILVTVLDMLAISVGMLTVHPYDDGDTFSVVMATVGYAKDQAWMEEVSQPEISAEQDYLSSIWGFLQHTAECDCNLCQGKYSPQQGY